MDILEVKNITKKFPGVRALSKVRFSIAKNEIHCICGENGAGKSTLMKIISGVYPHGSYEGDIIYNGKKTHYHTVKQSEIDGISIIHQELALSPYLSITENIFLGHEKIRYGILNERYMIQKTRALLERVKLDEHPSTAVHSLSVGKQQLVEIARALSKDVTLLILDEPTSSLNDKESAVLLELITELKHAGITCMMISHKLHEVMEIADTITVLRDGQTIATHNTQSEKIDISTIISEMVGRTLTHMYPSRNADVGTKRIEVKNWSVYHPMNARLKVIDNASFYAHKGEVVGICGLMGSGRTELMMSLFGKMYGSRCEGKMYIDEKQVNLASPEDAIKNGLCYVSEDRKSLGLILKQDVKTNISNSSLHLFSKYAVLNSEREVNAVKEYVNMLHIKTPTIDTQVATLSGGNQQKVVLSRCLLTNPEIFIIDEPTRGIDVGAKHEIYSIINTLAEQGKTIIIVSSELMEILGMADRIYIMNEGKIKGMLHANEADQEKIMHIALRDHSNSNDAIERMSS